MIHNLAVYLGIGTATMFIIELLATHVVPEANVTFKNKERLVGIAAWPLLILGLIIGKFKRR
jgi:hypothetical protein